MLKRFYIQPTYRSRQRQTINALLALATGLLTLSFPNFLYLIAGGYLIALGVLFASYKIPSVLSAIPVVAGLVIIIFPELIPITFAVFLGFFGLILLLAFHLSVMGILTLIIAALIISNPDSVAYLIASFLLLYAVSNLINVFQDWRNKGDDFDDDAVSIE